MERSKFIFKGAYRIHIASFTWHRREIFFIRMLHLFGKLWQYHFFLRISYRHHILHKLRMLHHLVIAEFLIMSRIQKDLRNRK